MYIALSMYILCVCVRVRVYVCMCACVCVCVYIYKCSFLLYFQRVGFSRGAARAAIAHGALASQPRNSNGSRGTIGTGSVGIGTGMLI